MAFDLFGTLVAAPTPRERARAASRLAAVLRCDPTTVDRYFDSTWQVRHNGTLPTLRDLASHLVRTIQCPDHTIELIAEELHKLARARLVAVPSVVDTLRSLRIAGLRLGICSDASAEIAAAWSKSLLAALVDISIFSCRAGATKPDQRLYGLLLRRLDVEPSQTLYVGDGGGGELQGALAAGMAAVAVRRRGSADALAFGETDWAGPTLDAVENVPSYLTGKT